MSTLDDIKARAETNSILGKTASQDEAKDTLKLVAALEAVEGMTGKLLDSSDSPPGQDDFNKGIDQGFAIAAKAIRSAIEDALA